MNGDTLFLNADVEQTFRGFDILNTQVGLPITNNAMANSGHCMALYSTDRLQEIHLPHDDQGHTMEPRIARGFQILSKLLYAIQLYHGCGDSFIARFIYKVVGCIVIKRNVSYRGRLAKEWLDLAMSEKLFLKTPL